MIPVSSPRRTVPAWFVRSDEPCYCIAEDNLPAPDSKGTRRYQTVTVVRDDQLANARIDLGPAEAFRAGPFLCPGGVTDETTGRITILHTVGELRDVADYFRAGLMAPPEVEPSDLNAEYHDLLDRRRKAQANQSLFGPAGHHQRSA